jgi:hypothetical protein
MCEVADTFWYYGGMNKYVAVGLVVIALGVIWWSVSRLPGAIGGSSAFDVQKANAVPTIRTVDEARASMSPAEWETMLATAQKAINDGSAAPSQFELQFVWKKGSWIAFHVVPKDPRYYETATLVLEYADGHWLTYGPSTAVSATLHELHPELDAFFSSN